jgi:integrase
VTVHGFRVTFATWAEECTDYPDGVREAALAHKYKSETMAAYQRGAKPPLAVRELQVSGRRTPSP